MIEDYVHEFKASNGAASKCRIRTFIAPTGHLHQGDLVIVATEMPDNPGMSITNAAETLVLTVTKKHQVQPMRMVWIEHYQTEARRYGAGDRRKEETFDRVAFDIYNSRFGQEFRHAVWNRISRETLEALIGEKFN